MQHLHALVERRQHHLDRERREGEDEVLGADRGAVGELLVLVREGLDERPFVCLVKKRTELLAMLLS